MMGWSWNYKKRENIACEGKFSLAFSDGTAVLSLWYDVREAPLTLTAAEGELRLVVLPHRLELWSDGRLCDEEWPYGTPKFDRAMLDAFGETADAAETVPVPKANSGIYAAIIAKTSTKARIRFSNGCFMVSFLSVQKHSSAVWFCGANDGTGRCVRSFSQTPIRSPSAQISTFPPPVAEAPTSSQAVSPLNSRYRYAIQAR